MDIKYETLSIRYITLPGEKHLYQKIDISQVSNSKRSPSDVAKPLQIMMIMGYLNAITPTTGLVWSQLLTTSIVTLHK